jgi:hypothetical protein
VLVLGNAALNTSITAASGSGRHVNRILGGIRSGGGYNVGINFALDKMSGSFSNNTGFYPGDSKTAADFLTKKLYADPIDLGDGLEFEFCEDVPELRRPCGEEYPWKLPSTASDYKYPILYWQNSNNPFAP